MKRKLSDHNDPSREEKKTMTGRNTTDGGGPEATMVGTNGDKKPAARLLQEEDEEDKMTDDDLDSQYKAVIANLHRRGFSKLARDVARVNPCGMRDPIAMLSDDLCIKIFSYCLPENPETVTHYGKVMTKISWLRSKAGRLYYQLSSVSKKWKEVCDKCPWADWVGLLGLKLTNRKTARSLMRWVLRHKIRLGGLWFFPQGVRVYEAGELDLTETKDAELLTNLFKGCQTNELVWLQMFTTYGSSPHHGPGHQLKILHDLIAEECPNLKNVGISLMLPKTTPIYSDYISESFFSIPSIKTLVLRVAFYDEDKEKPKVDPLEEWGTKTPIEGRLFTNLIQNLPQLETLCIDVTTIRVPLGVEEEVGNKIRFHITSPTLKLLSCLGWGTIVSVDCPALENLFLDGGRKENNNCVLDRLSREQFRALVRQSDGSTPIGYRAGRFPPAQHLVVPDECLLGVCNLREWGPDEYEEFMRVANENVNDSIDQTFV